MPTLKPKTRVAYSILLIVVILLNALTPTAAIAMSPGIERSNSSNRLGIPQIIKAKLSEIFRSQKTFIQEGTPTATETLTSEPTDSPPSSTEQPQFILEETLSPTPVLEPTPTASSTPVPIHTTTPSAELSGISLKFTARPEQAKPGDTVTFTLEAMNNGASSITNLHFSNTLPEVFTYIQGEGFTFDADTRELVWGSLSNPPLQSTAVLLPGETFILEYLVRVEMGIEGAQIIDTANFGAAELAEPLTAGTTLTLVDDQSSLTALDINGGEAFSVNGNISLDFPENALEAPVVVLIQDLGQELPGTPGQLPSMTLKLELLVPQEPQPISESSESLLTGAESVTSLEETSTPAPNDDPVLTENDQVIPLEAIEAQFNEPVELNISFDGLLDLESLTADTQPFLVTLDETSGVWVRVPLREIDREANPIKADLTHFSTWGIGFGPSFPQNGAGVLLFDNAYPTLFTGRAKYSIPLWTPPGRNGIAPSLALSYSSGSVDGVLGDVQAPWVGMGWSIDSAEIARKITTVSCTSPCSGGTYGYENEFVLLFNGTGHELFESPDTPGRYHTKEESFLYIQRHNDVLGNASSVNTTGEWWEVVEKDGTRWKLGSTVDSEQLAAMKGYTGTNPPATPWATLGYAGHAADVVALRWRVDQVTDVYDNVMTFSYYEESRTVAGTSASYDRASYLDIIKYTAYDTGTSIDYSKQGYSVVFIREERSGTVNDVPASPTDWDNWDTKRLDRVEVKYGTTEVRKYDLSYQVSSYSDGGASWQTTKLTSVAVSGSTAIAPLTNAPTVTFTYEDKENRAPNGSVSNEWHYPRLLTISNGWGSTATYSYDDDNRAYTSWYNWHVTTFDVTDSVNTNPKRVTFAYTTPVYGAEGELVGYQQTTETTLTFSLNTFAKTVHKFFTNSWDAVGREYETLYQNASGTTLRKTHTNWIAWWTNGYPEWVSFHAVASTEEYVLGSALDLIKTTSYSYDLSTGNLLQEQEFIGASTLYRQTDYEYVTNTSPSVWILETVARQTTKDASGAILSQQEYGYSGNLPGIGSPTVNQPDLSRIVNGTQTIDTKYVYDSYGNVTETRLFKNYGSTSSQPSGTYLTTLTGYDTALETYVLSADPPLIPATATTYDYGMGSSLSVTDPKRASEN